MCIWALCSVNVVFDFVSRNIWFQISSALSFNIFLFYSQTFSFFGYVQVTRNRKNTMIVVIYKTLSYRSLKRFWDSKMSWDPI